MDVDSLDASAPQADAEKQEEQPSSETIDQPSAAAASSASNLRPGLLLGAEVPVQLLATEDAKP